MSYQQYGSVDAADFNTLVGNAITSDANKLNTVLGVGNGKYGYGQTPVATVAQNTLVTASNWQELIAKTTQCGMHQSTVLQNITAPTINSVITYLSANTQNVKNIYNGKNNATTQGTTIPHTVSNATTWGNNLVFTFTVSFDTGDKARYFFNAGGQLKLTFNHPNGDRLNALLHDLANLACGTLVFSGMSATDTAVINGTTWRGFQKFGGSGTPVIYSQQYGYYGLTTTETTVFRQTVGTVNSATANKYNTKYASSYGSSYIQVSAKTNGPQGSNNDNGNIITFVVTFAELPTHGIPLNSGTSATLTVTPPSSMFLTNSWGSVAVDKTVTGASY